MPAVTPGGWPYVEPDDAVHDYPATSRALAERLDIVPVMQSGTVSMDVAGQTSKTQQVDFPQPFPAGTRVSAIVGVNNASGATANWHARAIATSTTGFTLFGFSGSNQAATAGTTLNVSWVAVALQ